MTGIRNQVARGIFHHPVINNLATYFPLGYIDKMCEECMKTTTKDSYNNVQCDASNHKGGTHTTC